MLCTPCDIFDADYFWVEDNEANTTIISRTNESFLGRNFKLNKFIKTAKMSFKEELVNSKYLGSEYNNEEEECIVSLSIIFYYPNSLIISLNVIVPYYLTSLILPNLLLYFRF